MADYFPPSENLPIFDVSVFRSTNDNVITQEEADRLYLSRLGTASSLATSTSFQGAISTTGNLTLNGAVGSSRIVESSFLRLVDNASISTNKPLINYPDPSLQITTNDPIGAVKTIDLVSYDGGGTNTSTSLSCRYGRVTAQGVLRLTRSTDATRFGSLTMGATELTLTNEYTGASPHLNLNTSAAGAGNVITNSPLQITNKADPTKASTITQGTSNLTISNAVSTGGILLNTNAGAIVANTPIVPADAPPILYLGSRPSMGYTRYGNGTAIAITSTAPITYTTTSNTPYGVWLFEASVTCDRGTSTFSTVAPLSSTRLTYAPTAGLVWGSLDTGFENPMFDLYTTASYCGCEGGSRVATITTAQQVQFIFQANWLTISGSPTFSIFWSAVRIG